MKWKEKVVSNLPVHVMAFDPVDYSIGDEYIPKSTYIQ